MTNSPELQIFGPLRSIDQIMLSLPEKPVVWCSEEKALWYFFE
jgi:hypothetical protein